MKTKNLFLGLIAIAALYFSACQKSLTFEDNTTPNAIDSTANLDSNYLSRYFYIETDLNLIDTAIKEAYIYDNLKRVTNIFDTTREPTINAPYDFFSQQFFYIGNDTLPYKKIHIAKVNSPSLRNDTITSFYTFSNGNLIIDSSIFFSNNFSFLTNNFVRTVANSIQTCSYLGNKVFGLKRYAILQSTNGILSSYVKSDTATIDQNGNVIAASYRKVSSNPSSSLFKTATLTYDNNPSALSKQNIKKSVSLFEDFYTSIEPGFTQNNNILKITEMSTNIFTEDFTGQYTYKQNGLPSIVRFPNINSGTGKGIFIYTAL
jgi:hypothetical protein